MQITPALAYEVQRQDAESWNKIILHKDGTFYHAYEWSAWLIKTISCTETFQKQRGDAKMLSAPRYKTKNNEYILIGFPIESLSKFIPEYTSLREMEGGDALEIGIDLGLKDTETFEELDAEFNKWKKAQPEAKKAGKTKDGDNVQKRTGLFQIIAEIVGYPLEKRTQDENTEFISYLKEKAAELL